MKWRNAGTAASRMPAAPSATCSAQGNRPALPLRRSPRTLRPHLPPDSPGPYHPPFTLHSFLKAGTLKWSGLLPVGFLVHVVVFPRWDLGLFSLRWCSGVAQGDRYSSCEKSLPSSLVPLDNTGLVCESNRALEVVCFKLHLPCNSVSRDRP